MKYVTNPMLLTDFYKTIHHLAYVPGMEYLTSYWTPRKSRIEGVSKVVMFGLQSYIQDFLIDTFDECFFNRPYDELHEEYCRIIKNTMNLQAADDTVMRELHKLGYLPLEIKAVDEGSRVPIRCPMIQITNTVPGYGWLVNYLETPTSASIWFPMTAATIAYKYREIVNSHFKKSVDDNIPQYSACGDFSMRGMSSIASAAPASAGHLTSFSVTATIEAIPWLEYFYNCDCSKELVGTSIPSMEHSVMESYGVNNEFECYKHLIEDVFPNGPLSIVSDTYDYWRVLTEYLPKLKDSIMKRYGKIIIRGDSGNPVDIICGTLNACDYMVVEGLKDADVESYYKNYASKKFKDGNNACSDTIRIGNTLYSVKAYYEWVEDTDSSNCGYFSSDVDEVEIEKTEITPEMKGTVELLWELTGGTINSKGYKVLDSHIGTIYGDGITPAYAAQIYSKLEDKGFAANNCTLGIGSYTYQYVTRDSLGFALKATHCTVNGEDKIIFKDPVTDKHTGNGFKASQRGLCHVYKDIDNNIKYCDGLLPSDFANSPVLNDHNLLTPVFVDGKLVKKDSLEAIRNRLYPKGF